MFLLFSLAHAQTFMVDASDYATPGDGVDDAPGLMAALDFLRDNARPGEDKVLYFDEPGAWEVWNTDHPGYGLLVDQSDVTLLCVRGASLAGDVVGEFPTKVLLSVAAPPGEVVANVKIEGCDLSHPRQFDAQKGAHAISLYGGLTGWVRDVTVRGVKVLSASSGDGVYCGLTCEGLTVEHVEGQDIARSLVTVAGNGQGVHRNDFRLEHLRAKDTPQVIDFEPNDPAHLPKERITGVFIRDVRAPDAQVDLSNIEYGYVADVWASKLATSRLYRVDFEDIHLECPPGPTGDGVGYCVANNLVPFVATFKGLRMNVDPAGAGAFYVRVPLASDDPWDALYAVKAEGRVRLPSGTHLIRTAGTVSDSFLVDLSGVVVE